MNDDISSQSLLNEKLNSILKERENLNEEILNLQKEIKEMEEKNNNLENENHNKNLEIASLKKKEKEINKIKEENEENINRLKSQMNENENLLKNLEKVIEERDILQEENTRKNQDIEELKNFINEFNSERNEEIFSSRTNEAIQNMEFIEEKVEKKDIELENYMKDNNKLMDQVKLLQQNLSQSENEKNSLIEVTENLKSLIKEKEEEIKQLKINYTSNRTEESNIPYDKNSLSKLSNTSLNDNEKIEKYKKIAKQYKSDVKNLEEQCEFLKNEIKILNEKLENKNDENVNQKLNYYENLLIEKNKELENKDEEINKLKNELLTNEENLPTDKFSISKLSNTSLNDSEKIEKYKKIAKQYKSDVKNLEEQCEFLKNEIKELKKQNTSLQKEEDNEELIHLFNVAFENYKPKKKEQIEAFQKLSEHFRSKVNESSSSQTDIKKKKGLFGLFNK